MRLVFFGTPDFAVPSLRGLAGRYLLAGVVTQPDRPAGRGRRLQSSPVKECAQELGLPILQPERIRSAEALAALNSWHPDLIVVVAFGQILPRSVLGLPGHGCVNVHASLLPRWRGASPVQAALLHGDATTGITLMKMDEGMDSGPIIAQRSLAIRPDHTGGSLTAELAAMGAHLLLDTLPAFLSGTIALRPQDHLQATFAPRLSRQDGRLDPHHPADVLERQVRAFLPSPGATLLWGDLTMKIMAAHLETAEHDLPAGTVADRNGSPALATGSGWL
ncbi:MAG TPA: methionyl-tRNA formyltransferase, partial [Anaerolineales bacterium]|nr:methionyl-tRNA formyltransferase [Anaerolineales bacterium]